MGFRGKPEPRRGDTYRNVFQHASIPVAPPGLGFLACSQPGVSTPGYSIPPFQGLEPAIANAWGHTILLLQTAWPPTKVVGKLRRAVRYSRFAGILGGRHDVGPSMVRNAGGVASNSLGCQPQGWVSAGSLNPEGVTHIATFSNMPASLSPLQGLDFWLARNQGLAPLAIPFRPSRA